MPTMMTFASLVNDMQSYLERGTVQDPLVFNQLPELINLAERRIATELKVMGFVIPATFSLQAGLAVYAKPDRWRQTVSMNVGLSATGTAVRQQMFARDYEYIRSYWPDESATSASVYGIPAPPKFYGDYNYQNIIVAPTPDAAYPAEIVYYEQPPLLDATNQTNWITEYQPNLLLYAALLEATPFLKKDDRIATWKAMYDNIVSLVNGQDVGKILDKNVTRNKD
jgi:hypothetical protein